MSEKLDSFSKILLATGQINYMAASIHEVNQEMKWSGLSEKPAHIKGSIEKDKILESVVKRLSDIMEDMGNLINEHDCICEIDARVSKVPFEIVCQGKDEVEKIYEDN